MRLVKPVGRRCVALLLAVVTGAGVLTGCSLGDGRVKVTLGLFGEFGYEELYAEYEREHPDVDVVPLEQDLAQLQTSLQSSLDAGSGAPDVVAIEEGFIVGFREQPEKFIDFTAEGVNPDAWLDWKWRQSLSADGRQIGLGTDVGGLAMCYRTDLFAQAGLPTDREEVSALWPTWDAYIATGQRFNQARTGKRFVDAATNTYNTILMQQGTHTYYDTDNRLVMATNPGIRQAWDYTTRMIQADLSANLVAFSEDWNLGMREGTFATIACPAWMMGYIKNQGGEGGMGKWDVARVPGGQGNWGGSFLAVPKQGEHVRQAIELAKWLTAPEQQIRTFKKAGTMPSSPLVYDSPEVLDYRDPYFNDAPVGRIFTEGASALRPVYFGPKNNDVSDAVEQVLREVEQGRTDTDDGWPKAVSRARRTDAR